MDLKLIEEALARLEEADAAERFARVSADVRQPFHARDRTSVDESDLPGYVEHMRETAHTLAVIARSEPARTYPTYPAAAKARLDAAIKAVLPPED